MTIANYLRSLPHDCVMHVLQYLCMEEPWVCAKCGCFVYISLELFKESAYNFFRSDIRLYLELKKNSDFKKMWNDAYKMHRFIQGFNHHPDCEDSTSEEAGSVSDESTDEA